MNFLITNSEKKQLRKIAQRISTQSHDHQKNITEYFRIMVEAMQYSFPEDNIPTVNGFAKECLHDALLKLPTEEEIQAMKLPNVVLINEMNKRETRAYNPVKRSFWAKIFGYTYPVSDGIGAGVVIAESIQEKQERERQKRQDKKDREEYERLKQKFEKGN